MWQRLFPFLRWWPEVNRHSLKADTIAGLTGAVVVLPQGVAFATIAGMPPEYGLYAAMFPAVVAALFGSSRLLVSGPTTAASIVLFSILSELAEPGSANYVYLALTLTFMVGLIQLGMGLARLGHLVNFISHSVIIGFTTGAAFLIVASQIQHFFGLYMPRGLVFHEIIETLYRNFAHINMATTAVGVGTVVVGLLIKRFYPRAPFMIVAIIFGSVLAFVLNTFTDYFVALIGIVPAAFPPLSTPNFSFRTWQQLAPGALAVTLFALTEAVSISRSLAARTGELVDGNQEFIGQGLSNMVGAFFSAYVATGSFNRSGVNYEAGARTPMASIFAAFMLILILLLVGPLLAYLPKAVMAGVLFLVAAGLINISQIRVILKASQSDSLVLVTTFFATLLLELDFAILLGVLLSLVIYLHRASRPRVRVRVPDPRQPKRRFSTDPSLPQCPQMKLIRIDGAVFFGAVNYVSERLRIIFKRNPEQKHLLILARPVSFIDVAGAEMLVREHRQRKAIGGGIYFHQLQDQALEILRKSGYFEEIGEDHFFDNKGDAISGVFARLDRDICRTCKRRIFNECKSVPQEEPREQQAAPESSVAN